MIIAGHEPVPTWQSSLASSLAEIVSHTPSIEIRSDLKADVLDLMRALFKDYAADIGIDLSFQNFELELLELPGQYQGPRGALVAAFVDDALAGCCAMRPLDTVDYPDACEMKRLFVRKAFRGLGLGRLLAEAILDSARVAGYRSILLDTLSDMEAARAMYEGLGFVEVPPYYHNPISGAHYLKADL